MKNLNHSQAPILSLPYCGLKAKEPLCGQRLAKIENDRIVDGAMPPGEMLLGGGYITYGTIIDVLKSTKREDYIEHARYRIAQDGAFVHRVVDTQLFEFYFRGLTEDKNERPYSILRRL